MKIVAAAARRADKALSFVSRKMRPGSPRVQDQGGNGECEAAVSSDEALNESSLAH
jgi:hypothetical protein